MDISVLFSTYKRTEILSRTLRSFCDLNTEGFTWEIIAVDNAGDEATKQVVYSFRDKLPIKFLVETKPGKNNALNRALPEAKGELFVFTDDDIIADPDWLKEMWKGAKRWPDNYVFGGKILPAWLGKKPWWGENHPLNISLFALHEPYVSERPYEPNDFLPYGPNMAIRKKMFERGYKYNPDVGPTNKSIYKMGSETELLKRLRDDGFKHLYLPNAVVRHQIREDQLTKAWLKRRNFRIGYADGIDGDVGTNMLNCSRYLWKQFVLSLIAYTLYCGVKKKLNAFEAWCKLWRTAGKMYGQLDSQKIHDTFGLKKMLSWGI